MAATPKTVTRMDLAEAVYHEVGLSRKLASEMVDLVFEEMIKVLDRVETVKISSFGNFYIRSKRERVGRNPKTGDAVELTGKYVPHFKPGKELRERVNLGLQMGL